MAQYEIHMSHLFEAGAEFKKLADGLDEITQRMEKVICALKDESIPELRQRLVNEKYTISNVSVCSNRIGQTLKDISGIYARAEDYSFSGRPSVSGNPNVFGSPDSLDNDELTFPSVSATTPDITKPSGLLLFGDLVIPDWVQIAVIKYEQSQT